MCIKICTIRYSCYQFIWYIRIFRLNWVLIFKHYLGTHIIRIKSFYISKYCSYLSWLCCAHFFPKDSEKKLFILCPLIGITETDSLYIDTYIYNKVDILSYHVHVYNDLTIYIMSYFLEFLMQHVQKSTFKIRFDIQYFCTPYFSTLYTFSLYYKKVPKFK